MHNESKGFNVWFGSCFICCSIGKTEWQSISRVIDIHWFVSGFINTSPYDHELGYVFSTRKFILGPVLIESVKIHEIEKHC